MDGDKGKDKGCTTRGLEGTKEREEGRSKPRKHCDKEKITVDMETYGAGMSMKGKIQGREDSEGKALVRKTGRK